MAQRGDSLAVVICTVAFVAKVDTAFLVSPGQYFHELVLENSGMALSTIQGSNFTLYLAVWLL
jgi:hypothetical protein